LTNIDASVGNAHDLTCHNFNFKELQFHEHDYIRFYDQTC